ncbi:Neuroblast differentiation-associated protein AHNAK, partial [Megadyptes antipodes antipodes]
KTKFGISMPKRKEPGTENTKPGSDVPHSVLEKTADTSSEDGRHLDVKPQMPDEESEVSTWKIQMPSFKMAKTPKADMKTPREESTIESLDTVKKAQTEEDGMPMTDKTLKMDMGMKAGEKDIEGKESKFRLPKFKLPTFTWATTKDETGQTESLVSDREGKAPSLETGAKTDMSESEEQMKIPKAEIETGISKGKINEKDVKKLTEVQLPSLKHLTAKKFSVENHFEETEVEILITKPDIEIQKGELSISSKETEEMAKTMTAAGEGPALGLKADIPGTKTEGAGWKVEKPSLKMPKADIKAPKVDISLPSVDVTLPKASVDLQAPEAALTLEGEAKAPEKEAAKTKDGKFKMPKFGMPSFGWSSSREAKGTVAADVDVSLKEPQVTVPSGTAEVDVTLPAAEIQAPTFEVVIDSPCGKDDEMCKSKSSLFRMPKVSLSKSSKPQGQCKSGAEMSVSEALCYSVTEETPAVFSGSVGSKLPDTKGDSGSKNTKFRIPSLGFSKVDIGSSKIEQDSPLGKEDITLTKYQMNLAESESKISSLADENLSITDFEILNEDGSLEQGSLKPGGKTPAAEISVGDTEFTVKIPKFRKPKFGISRSKGKPSESDVVSKVKSEISKGRITHNMTDTDIEKPTQISDAELGVKMDKPSCEIVLDAPNLDVSLPSVEVTMPKLEVEIHGPDLECKVDQEVVSGEKDTEEKENKFKTSKFKLPSFSWSPKKEAIAPSEVEGHLEEPTLPTLSGDTESELTFPTPENQYLHGEFDISTEKDGEKGRNKKSQFTMPKISFPKIKGQKVQVSLPILETDICGPKQEKEGVSVQKSEKGSSGEEAGMGIKMPKVTVPTLEFSKPEVKAPKTDMDVSMPTGEFILPTCEDDLTLKSAAADASLSTSFVKMVTEDSLEVKSPDTSVEKTSNEIAVGDIEIKIEGPEGKTKMSKFQMPKFGIIHSKGKGEGDDSIQTPDIERSHSERTEEGAQISIKLADVDIPTLEFSKIETGASQTEMGVSSAKIDAVLPPSEGSFQQVVLKSSSTDEDTIQKTGIKFPRGEVSIELRSPEIVTERSSVVDGRKMKLEGPEGKTKMPKFQKPKFGISLTKGKVPETEISSPKIEAELPQLKMTNEIADIAVGIPASELTSDMSDPGVEGIPKLGDSVKSSDVSLSKIEGDTSLSTERTDSRVNIPKTETYADIVKHGAEGQKMHTSEFTVSSAELSKSYLSTSEIDKDNSLTSRFPAITVETVDKSQGGPEVNIKIPKLKIPRFTFKALPTEIDVSVSKVVTDPKGSSTDIEI